MDECPSSEDLLAKTREKITKCKCICLDEMGLSFDTNPRYMGKYEKDKLVKRVGEWMAKTDDQVQAEFNSLVCDKWLISGKDYSNYPVYDMGGNKIDK
jgi:hypothetical protein